MIGRWVNVQVAAWLFGPQACFFQAIRTCDVPVFSSLYPYILIYSSPLHVNSFNKHSSNTNYRSSACDFRFVDEGV